MTARNILRLDAEDDEPAVEGNGEPIAATEPEASPGGAESSPHDGEAGDTTVELPAEPDLPTQVLLCELIRYLDLCLSGRSDGGRPHVAIVVAAWDLLDPGVRAGGPMAYLKREFPLFAGRLADTGRLDVRLFGLSVVGGDLRDDDEFRNRFFERDISEQGWVIVEDKDGLRTDDDVMLPIAWAMGD